MRDIRLRYVLRERGGDMIRLIHIHLEDIERGEMDWIAKCTTWDVIAVDEYIRIDSHDGKPIFEGDIIRRHDPYIYDYDDPDEILPPPIVVKWGDAYSGPQWCGVEKDGRNYEFYGGIPDAVEILGNIHQNPELMEG